MSVEYILDTIGQPSIYNPQIRKYTVYFDIPEKSIGVKSGVLLLVAGFGGSAVSKVYIKMRKLFADKYNLVTVQCDYFGSEFMQSEVLTENDENFCEMGPAQAMDNLIALKCVKDWLDENRIEYNDKNVIAYGHSHGAYLCYLMNALMPNVLSCIIDNSAWLFPDYINGGRQVVKTSDSRDIELQFYYLISKLIFDRDIYSLEKMYTSFQNSTKIFSFHGTSDDLVPINDKLVFLSGVNNSSIEILGQSRINDIFKSCTHGLEADFLKMFDYVYKKYKTNSDESVYKFENRIFETSVATYNIDNSDGIPILYCMPKKS